MVLNGLLNFIFISIPEQIVLAMFYFLCINNRSMLDTMMFKYNFKKYFLLIVPNAIVMNVLKYCFKIDNIAINFIIGYIILVASLNIINKKFKPITLLMVLVSYLFIMISEIVCVSPVLAILNTTMEIVNQDLLCKFFVFLPLRFLQFTLLFIFILIYNTNVVNFLKLRSNKNERV